MTWDYGRYSDPHRFTPLSTNKWTRNGWEFKCRICGKVYEWSDGHIEAEDCYDSHPPLQQLAETAE